MIYIKKEKTINWDKGSYQIPHIYDKLFIAAKFSDEQKMLWERQRWLQKCK